MIMENLSVCLEPIQIEKVKNCENSLETRMQKQLMDFSNYTDGTIFDNIIKINQEMTKKMKMRIDLRQDSKLDEFTKEENPMKQ